MQEKCKDPCLEISPCTTNAKCTVHNSLPLRTMSCTCLPGFTGKGDERCDKISKLDNQNSTGFLSNFYFNRLTVAPIEVGCTSDGQCSTNEACRSGNCVNPCIVENPCSSTAACYVSNHKAQCRCPPGFTGDPYSRCVQSKKQLTTFVQLNSK